jgi:hypothetical protein
MIQPNLFEALKAIRKEDEEVCFWADGICINQSDTTERNHQVGLMGKIYQSAKNVRVWVGPAAEESDFVLDYVERDEDRFQREKAGETLDKIPESEEKAFLEAFRAFHRRPYWGRAWIKQEVILAKELIIHCGTKSAKGLRLFVLAHWHCFWDHAVSDEIANLSMHRLNMRDGKRESLEVLLKRYGRTGCTDTRDRVFSILSIAADCKGMEEAIADYSISLPALFFAVLSFIEPQHIISLATSLHEILEVRRTHLLEYWNKIEDPELVLGMEPPRTESKMENLGICLVWMIKTTQKLIKEVKEIRPDYVNAMKTASGREFDEICRLMSLTPFFVHICQLLDLEPKFDDDASRELEKEDYVLLRISNTHFFIMARKTFFGLRFVHIFEKQEDPSVEKGYTLEAIEPIANHEGLKPFMIYPRIVLQNRSMSSEKEYGSTSIAHRLILMATYGSVVLEPPVEVMCSILLELDRLSGDRGICTNDCRSVLEACGYELTLLENQLAQFRIQAEHEGYYGTGRRERRLLEDQSQENQ